MRKEVLVAIILGFLLGLLVVGGLWWSNRSDLLPNFSGQEEAETPLEGSDSSGGNEPEAEKQEGIFLDINSPEEGAIIDADEVEIKGKTIARAIVVIIYPDGETIVTAGEDGSFSGTALLSGGANEIKVTAYDYQGNQKEVVLTVVYSTAKL